MKTATRKTFGSLLLGTMLVLGFTVPASLAWARDHDRHHDRHDRYERRHDHRRHAHHWDRHYHRDYIWPAVAATYAMRSMYQPRTTVVYQTVRPAPVIYQTVAAPVLANQASTTYISSGQACREYQSSAWIAGRWQPTYGTACLQPDGTWRAVD